jgi:hypothetical protein
MFQTDVLRAESEAWLQSFSLDAYRPMLRLASSEDRCYLKSHRTRRMARRYRRVQRILLREYLRGLSRDFQKLHAIAAKKDSSLELFDGHLGFIFGLWLIEARLVLQSVVPHSIDMEPLLQSVQALAEATREMARPVLKLHVT